MPGDKDEGTPKALKEGEVGISEKDLASLKKAKADMQTYKRELGETKGDLDDLQEEVTALKEAQKAKEGEGSTDITAAVEKAVADAHREAEKAHKKEWIAHEQKLTVQWAAQLALVNAGAKELYLGSIDLKDVTDPETAKERVQAFLTENPEVVGKQKERDPKVPPVTTGPTSGPAPPGGKPEEGPKTAGEREGILRKQFAEDGFAVSRSTGQVKAPG